MTWTSVEAYRDIANQLPERREAVLHSLLKYVQRFEKSPTSMELAKWMDLDRSNVSNRLSELENRYHAVHQGEARSCEVTGILAVIWVPGPADGLELLIRAGKMKPNLTRLMVDQLEEDRKVFERVDGFFEQALSATSFILQNREEWMRDFRTAIAQRMEDIDSTLKTVQEKRQRGRGRRTLDYQGLSGGYGLPESAEGGEAQPRRSDDAPKPKL